MSNTNYESTIDYQKYFDIVEEGELKGQVSLKPAYRGDGYARYPESVGDASKLELPEMLVIPDIIGETPVCSLVSGMFANNKHVKGITLPATVEEIPDGFCYGATNLRTVMGTKHIKSIGYIAFFSTRIKNALFPNLTELKTQMVNEGTMEVGRAFSKCAYLEVVDIGKVTVIAGQTFMNCARLRKVIGGQNVTAIGLMAFAHTHNLRELPLLKNTTAVEADTFFYSGIRVGTLPEGNSVVGNAFPTTETEKSDWNNVDYTECQNRLITKMSQLNPAWAEERFLQGEPTEVDDHPYKNACAIFSAMHIHSAISGKYYHHPCEFVQELKDRGLSRYVHTDGWPGDITKVPELFEDLGYRTEICGKYSDLTIEDYQKLADALAAGAYIYTQVSTSNNVDYGHAAVIYGMTVEEKKVETETGTETENEGESANVSERVSEVCVLDSNVLYEDYRDYGFEPNTDIYTYTIPFTNIVGPESNFIIVYPPEKKTVVERTICAVDNAYTSASLPSEYPVDWVTTCCVTNDEGLPSPHNGILTAYRGKNYAYRTFVPHDQTVLHMQMKSLDEEDGDKWLEWSTFGSAGTTNDSSGETPSAE